MLSVKEFISPDSHNTEAREQPDVGSTFYDGNLMITAVELILPCEPPLSPCASLTEDKANTDEDHCCKEATGKKEAEQHLTGEKRDRNYSELEQREKNEGERKERRRGCVVDDENFSNGDRSSRIILAVGESCGRPAKRIRAFSIPFSPFNY